MLSREQIQGRTNMLVGPAMLQKLADTDSQLHSNLFPDIPHPSQSRTERWVCSCLPVIKVSASVRPREPPKAKMHFP